MGFVELLESAPENLAIVDALGKCNYQVKTHRKIMCSVSGGSDSDVMMDLIIRCGGKDKTTFVFFNTGLEYNLFVDGQEMFLIDRMAGIVKIAGKNYADMNSLL